jgi:hypothetical protein
LVILFLDHYIFFFGCNCNHHNHYPDPVASIHIHPWKKMKEAVEVAAVDLWSLPTPVMVHEEERV